MKEIKTNHHSQRLGQDPVFPLLVRLAIPGIVAMSVQSLYEIVDSIFVGRLGSDALSALTLTIPVNIFLLSIAIGTGIGTSSLISRLLGRGDRESAVRVAEHVIVISLVYGLIMALVGIFATPYILRFFTSDYELIELGSQYIRIILIGSVAIFLPMIGNNVLRGQGNTVFPMVTTLAGCILNILFDPLFIFGLGFFPRLEVAGAAVATVLARFCSGLVILWFLFSKKNEIRPSFKDFRIDFTILRELYRVGLPAIVMQSLFSVMMGGLNLILGTFSNAAIAVGGIFFRLQSFVVFPIIGLNHGFMPIVGYNYGNKTPERVKRTLKIAFSLSFIYCTLGMLVFLFFPAQLILLFNDDPKLLDIGITALRNVSLAFPIIGPAIIAESTFQALGYGLPSLILSMLRQCVILVPLFFILGHFLGLDILWFAWPISEVVNIILAFIWLRAILRRVFARMEQEGG